MGMTATENPIKTITRTLKALGLSNSRERGRDFKVSYYVINGERVCRDVILYGWAAEQKVRDNAQRIAAETGFTVTVSKHGFVRIGR